ncbi:MAG: hypothetical protein VX740_02175, partial [Pseudomonadota bacterium]|nr:hypothetical protein [Pseudomonadota bacterium]
LKNIPSTTQYSMNIRSLPIVQVLKNNGAVIDHPITAPYNTQYTGFARSLHNIVICDIKIQEILTPSHTRLFCQIKVKRL